MLVVAFAMGGQAFASACSPDTTSGLIDTSDVTFRSGESDACAGQFNGNDSLSDVNVNLLNFDDWGIDPWQAFMKSDGPTTASLFGLDWSLSADENQVSGSWTLSVLSDPVPADLPVTLDLLVVLKGGNEGWVGYRFDDEVFSVIGANAGTFEINFENTGGQTPALSHLSLFARESGDGGGDPTEEVPEPGVLALLGIGLLGIASSRKSNVA